MRFILPGLTKIFGLWQLTTKGAASSIEQIIGVIDTVEQMRGSIVGVPFDLVVKMHKSQTPGSKSRYPVLSLIPHASEQNPMTELNGGSTGLIIGNSKHIG